MQQSVNVNLNIMASIIIIILEKDSMRIDKRSNVILRDQGRDMRVNVNHHL